MRRSIRVIQQLKYRKYHTVGEKLYKDLQVDVLPESIEAEHIEMSEESEKSPQNDDILRNLDIHLSIPRPESNPHFKPSSDSCGLHVVKMGFAWHGGAMDRSTM